MTVPSAPPAPAAVADPLERLGLAFKHAMVAVRRLRGRETHHADELSYAQYSLLFGLANAGELSARDLACAADLSPATVTQMLDHLAAQGLVSRVRSSMDKRVVLSSLTERGQTLVATRRARLESRWRAALAGFSAEQLEAAAAVLDRLGQYFDDFAEE